MATESQKLHRFPSGNDAHATEDKHETMFSLLRYTLYALILMGIIAVSGLEIWNGIRTSDLQHQVRQLNTELTEIKHLINQFDDPESFENVFDSLNPNLQPNPGENINNDNYSQESEQGTDYSSESAEDNDYVDENGASEDQDEPVNSRKRRSLDQFVSSEIEHKDHVSMTKKDFVNNAHFHRAIKDSLTSSGQTDQYYESDRLDNASEHEKQHIDVHRPKSRRSRVNSSNTNISPPVVEYQTTKPKHSSQKPHGKKSMQKSQHVAEKKKSRVLRHMRRNLETRGRTVAIQYEGDTSHLGITEHHRGNGLIVHHGGTYTNWKPALWTNTLSTSRFFGIENGVVDVIESGLYQVYAQIFYHDGHASNSFHVVHNNNNNILQCTTMVTTNTASISSPAQKFSNTCYTSGLVHLRAGDTICITDTGNNRHSILAAGKSFFGLIRVSDAREVVRDRS